MKEEMVDIVDKEDTVIDTAPRSKMRKENLLHRTAVILVQNSKGEFLIHKRTKTKDVFPSYHDIYFGEVVSKGESYERTAKRELEEELGLKEVKLNFLFKTRVISDVIQAFYGVFSIIYGGPFKFQKEEVEKAFFVSKKELLKMIKNEKFTPSCLKIFKEYLKYKK